MEMRLKVVVLLSVTSVGVCLLLVSSSCHFSCPSTMKQRMTDNGLQTIFTLNSIQQRELAEYAESDKKNGKLMFSVDNAKIIRRCTPKTNIVFVKVHKAGSSTVTNILQRFGRARNLAFALPNKTQHIPRYNYIGKSCEYLKKQNLKPLTGNRTFNILCNHVIYNRTSFHEIFPADSLYLTIVRNPLSQFISTMNYYSSTAYIQNILNSSSNPLRFYLQNPKKFEPGKACNSFSNNRQLTDLGYLRDLRNKPEVDLYVDSLVRDFHVVMIMERFDESLILLKRKACWGLKDILYIPQNIHWQNKYHNLTSEDVSRFEDWYYGDVKLYDTMYKRFTDAVQSESADFFKEVQHFKKIRYRVTFHCLKRNRIDIYFNATDWDDGFVVTNDDCKMLMTRELKFLDILMREHAS